MIGSAPPGRAIGRGLPGAAALIVLLLLGACRADDARVRGSGTIEMDEVDVSSLVGGRVATLAVDEGDPVRAGDTLAVLDRGEITAALEAQAAEAGRATSQWRDLEQGPRASEIGAARADRAAAIAQAQLAESDFKRIEKLFAGQLASEAELDRGRSARDAANAKAKAATDQLRLVEAGVRRNQVQAAAQAAQAAVAQLAGARSRASELLLTAPISGVVLLRNYESGEVAQPGVPILTLGNPDRLWVRVYIGAPHLTRVRLGARADVRVVGSKRVFTGRVVEVASKAEFTPRAALTEEEQSHLVFGVKIALDPTGGVLKAGLPADAVIHEPDERAR
jgi:HlyD family secretion protein